MKIYPPFPVPDFAPNFTGYAFDELGVSWNEIYKSMAHPANDTVFWVNSKG